MNLNYAVYLYNLGERKAAAKQYNLFEQKLQALQQSNPNDIDPEVSTDSVMHTAICNNFI